MVFNERIDDAPTDDAKETPIETNDAAEPIKKPKRKQRKPKKKNVETKVEFSGTTPETAEKESATPAVKKPKQPKPEKKNLPLTETILYVGNLPFEIDDESLKEIFESSHKVKSSHVVKRGKRNSGYGFVEFFDSATMLSALEEFSGVKANNRTLRIKRAFLNESKEEPEK